MTNNPQKLRFSTGPRITYNVVLVARTGPYASPQILSLLLLIFFVLVPSSPAQEPRTRPEHRQIVEIGIESPDDVKAWLFTYTAFRAPPKSQRLFITRAKQFLTECNTYGAGKLPADDIYLIFHLYSCCSIKSFFSRRIEDPEYGAVANRIKDKAAGIIKNDELMAKFKKAYPHSYTLFFSAKISKAEPLPKPILGSFDAEKLYKLGIWDFQEFLIRHARSTKPTFDPDLQLYLNRLVGTECPEGCLICLQRKALGYRDCIYYKGTFIWKEEGPFPGWWIKPIPEGESLNALRADLGAE